MNDMAKNLVLWVIIALVLMMVFNKYDNPALSGDISYSQFISYVKTGQIASVGIEGSSIQVIWLTVIDYLLRIVLKPVTTP